MQRGVEAKVPEVAKYLDGDRRIVVDEADEVQLLAHANTALNGLLRQRSVTQGASRQIAGRPAREVGRSDREVVRLSFSRAEPCHVLVARDGASGSKTVTTITGMAWDAKT